MQISRIRALRGPNIWTRSTAMEAVVHCDASERDITRLPGLEERLRARFPRIGTLRPEGADVPVSLAEVVEAAAHSLQALAGCPVTFSRTHATVEEGTYQVVVEYTEEAVGRLAMEQAERLVQAALADTPSTRMPWSNSCASWTRTSASAPPPAPSWKPPWPGHPPSAG